MVTGGLRSKFLVQPLPACPRIWGSASVDQITTDWTPISLVHTTTYGNILEVAYLGCLDKSQTGRSWRIQAEQQRMLPQGEILDCATSKAASAIGFPGSLVSTVAATAPGLQQLCKIHKYVHTCKYIYTASTCMLYIYLIYTKACAVKSTHTQT